MLTERAFGRLRTLWPQPDVVVITGDMTDCGLPEEYALLRHAALSPTDAGVHGARQPRPARQSKTRLFPDWPTIAADPDFVQFVVDDYPLRLIGLDTVVEKSSAGALCERRLACRSEALDAEPKRATVIFMHHPPFDLRHPSHGQIRLIDGSAELAAILLKRHPQILGLWCGHNHRPIETCSAACRRASSPAWPTRWPFICTTTVRRAGARAAGLQTAPLRRPRPGSCRTPSTSRTIRGLIPLCSMRTTPVSAELSPGAPSGPSPTAATATAPG